MGVGQSTLNENHSPVELPQLTRHPKDTTNAIKTTAFTIDATGTDLSFLWERKPLGEGDNWQLLPIDDDRIEGANTSQLGITHLQKSDEGCYRCTVSNEAGKIVSSPALLTLAELPQITAQPTDKTNAIKATAFTAAATGTDLNFQWEKKPPGEGDNWQPLPIDDDRIKGANTSQLGITHLQKSDQGSYRCTVSNQAGKIVSNPALLTLADPVKIISQPQDKRNIAPKSTVEVSLEATGTETLEYTWERNPDGDKVVDTTRKKTMAGEAASDAIRTFFAKLCKQVTPEDVVKLLFSKEIISEREMKCATNKFHDEDDRVLVLLQVLMRNVQSRPNWFHQICEIFDEARVASTQDIREEYQRKLKEAEGWKPLPTDGSRYEGVHTPTLTITSVQRSDQGSYRCIVYNDSGSETSQPAVVTVVEPPEITSHPQHQQEVVPGTEVSFTVNAFGTQPLKYAWMWRPLESTEDTWSPAGGKGVQGADTPTLTITAAQGSHQGRYRCVVSNHVGSGTSDPALLSLAEPPQIKSHPKCDNEVLTRETVTISVEVEGSGSPSCSWKFKPAGQDSDEQLTLEEGIQFQGTTTAVLTIANIQKSNSGSYECVVTNRAGMAISNAVTLKVLSPDDIINHLKDICRDESTLADKTTAVRNFVQKYGSTSEIVKKGLMAVVGMEQEEVEIVRAFLEYPCLVPAEFEQDGLTPLQCASQNGHTKVARLLLDSGARADTCTEGVRSPLHLAAEGGHPNIIMFLIYNNVDVNAKDNDGRTPLHAACKAAILPKDFSSSDKLYQLTQVVAYLLTNNAKLEIQDKTFQTPLHTASKAGVSMKIMELLLQREQIPFCINFQDKEGNTALHLACAGAHREIIGLLVQKGASLRAQNQEGNTPLHLAAMHCPDDLMKILVKRLKKSTNSLYLPNKDGNTLLHLASAQGLTETVKKILKYDPHTISTQNKDDKTSLHLACQGGFYQIVEVLLQKADPNILDRDGNTPLYYACHGDGFRNIIQLLLCKGADPTLKNKEGHTPVFSRHRDLLQTTRRMSMGPLVRSSSTLKSSASAGYGSAFGESWNSHTSKPASRWSAGYGSISESWTSSLGSGTCSRKRRLTATAARNALDKCSEELATHLTPKAITALFNLIEAHELTVAKNPLYEEHQRAYNLLQHLTRKVGEKPSLFDEMCTVLETETPTAAKDLKVVYDKELKTLQLMQACEHGNIPDTKKLIQDYGPDSEIVQKSFMAVVMMDDEEHLDIVKTFLESGVSPNITLYGQTLIQCACLNGYLKTMECLLERGADRDVLTEDKKTLLHLACEKGYNDIVSYLLTVAKTDVNRRDKTSRTPLHDTCDAVDRSTSPSFRSAILTIAEQLLGHGAERDAQNEDGNSPLHVASKSGNVDLAKMLLEKDPEHRAINLQNTVGNTPLHVAASAEFQDVVELLIQYDADPAIRNQEKKRPADVARPSKLARLLSSQKKLDLVKSKSDRKNSQFYT